MSEEEIDFFESLIIELIKKISKEEFITFLIITRLSYICSSPEILLNYTRSKDDFFEDLKEGVDSYNGKTIIQKEKNHEGVWES